MMMAREIRGIRVVFCIGHPRNNKLICFSSMVFFGSWARGGGAYPGAECRSRERAESQRLHAALHGGAREPRQRRQVPAEQRR